MDRITAPARELDLLGPLLQDFQLLGDGIERLLGNLAPRPTMHRDPSAA